MRPCAPLRLGPLVVFGVGLAFAAPAPAADTPGRSTFSKDVAPIFQAKCQACHQPNSIAPMSLITYPGSAAVGALDQGARRARGRCRRGTSTASVGVQKFKNDMSLTDEQVDTIVALGRRRRAAGRPEGHAAAQAARHRQRVAGVNATASARPTSSIKSPEYTMPAEHQDVWWRPMSDIPLTEPRWVSMVEIRPTNLQGAQDHASLDRLPRAEQRSRRGQHRARRTAATAGRDADDLVNRRPQLMEWAIGKGYDLYPAGHRQADAAGREDLVGSAHSRRRRRDHRRLRDRHLVLPEGPGAEEAQLPRSASPACRTARRCSTSRRTRSRTPKASRC